MPVKSLVVGCNERLYQPKTDHVVENASCTTKSALHPLHALDDAVGITDVILMTVHAETGGVRRKLVETMGKVAKLSDLNFRGQATGAQGALAKFFPGATILARARRVPVSDGSLSDMVVTLKQSLTPDEVRTIIWLCAKNRVMQVLNGKFGESSALIGNPHDAVVFAGDINVLGERVVTLSSGYDNGYAPAAAAHDLMAYMAQY